MKQLLITFFAVSAILSLASCSKVESSTGVADALYKQMVDYSIQIGASVKEGIITKSEAPAFIPEYLSDIDKLDSKYIEYIELYTAPENVYDWDESVILTRLSADERFSQSERDCVVKCIACAFFLKNEFADVAVGTKTTAEECYEQWCVDMRRANRTMVLAVAAAILEPTLYGELAAVTYYYIAISDAEEDYNRCMAKAQK